MYKTISDVLYVDKITYLDESEVIGIKNVTANEPFFKGHFPLHPIVPGVILIEAMAQTAGVIESKKYEDAITLFKSALKIQPENIIILYNIARLVTQFSGIYYPQLSVVTPLPTSRDWLYA